MKLGSFDVASDAECNKNSFVKTLDKWWLRQYFLSTWKTSDQQYLVKLIHNPKYKAFYIGGWQKHVIVVILTDATSDEMHTAFDKYFAPQAYYQKIQAEQISLNKFAEISRISFF